jgi:hypothetical protein
MRRTEMCACCCYCPRLDPYVCGGLCSRSHLGGCRRKASADLRCLGAGTVHGLVITFHNDSREDFGYPRCTILGQGRGNFGARSRQHCLGLHRCISERYGIRVRRMRYMAEDL